MRTSFWTRNARGHVLFRTKSVEADKPRTYNVCSDIIFRATKFRVYAFDHGTQRTPRSYTVDRKKRIIHNTYVFRAKCGLQGKHVGD